MQSDEGNRRTYNVQQDGFLRRFDPAGILWPTGYFLTLCVSAPNRCRDLGIRRPSKRNLCLVLLVWAIRIDALSTHQGLIRNTILI